MGCFTQSASDHPPSMWLFGLTNNGALPTVDSRSCSSNTIVCTRQQHHSEEERYVPVTSNIPVSFPHSIDGATAFTRSLARERSVLAARRKEHRIGPWRIC